MEKLKQNKYYIIGGIILLLLAYGYGRYMQPAEVITKTETLVKEIVKTQKEKRTIKKIITRPDGAKEEIYIDEEIDVAEKSKEEHKKSEKIVINKKPQWKASALAIQKDGDEFGKITYGAIIERRIFGSLFIGVNANQDKDIGLSIGMEF